MSPLSKRQANDRHKREGPKMSQADKQRWVLVALDEYEVRLLRYALRLVGDQDLARDAVQHAFVKLCDQAPESVGERPAAWLFRVCRKEERR